MLVRHDISVGVRGQAQAAVLTSHLVQASLLFFTDGHARLVGQWSPQDSPAPAFNLTEITHPHYCTRLCVGCENSNSALHVHLYPPSHLPSPGPSVAPPQGVHRGPADVGGAEANLRWEVSPNEAAHSTSWELPICLPTSCGRRWKRCAGSQGPQPEIEAARPSVMQSSEFSGPSFLSAPQAGSRPHCLLLTEWFLHHSAMETIYIMHGM